MMSTIDKLENQISLLSQALKFYANPINYKNINNEKSLIESDEYGSQARFALEQLEKNEVILDDINNEYDELIGDAIRNIEIDSDETINVINKIKNIIKNNGNKI